MWRETPENYAKSALGPQDGALSDVSVVSPFKCCHQASNLEYLKRCVLEQAQVPRLVKARENRAALQASLLDATEFSPAGTESTTSFASRTVHLRCHFPQSKCVKSKKSVRT